MTERAQKESKRFGHRRCGKLTCDMFDPNKVKSTDGLRGYCWMRNAETKSGNDCFYWKNSKNMETQKGEYDVS